MSQRFGSLAVCWANYQYSAFGNHTTLLRRQTAATPSEALTDFVVPKDAALVLNWHRTSFMSAMAFIVTAPATRAASSSPGSMAFASCQPLLRKACGCMNCGLPARRRATARYLSGMRSNWKFRMLCEQALRQAAHARGWYTPCVRLGDRLKVCRGRCAIAQT